MKNTNAQYTHLNNQLRHEGRIPVARVLPIFECSNTTELAGLLGGEYAIGFEDDTPYVVPTNAELRCLVIHKYLTTHNGAHISEVLQILGMDSKQANRTLRNLEKKSHLYYPFRIDRSRLYVDVHGVDATKTESIGRSAQLLLFGHETLKPAVKQRCSERVWRKLTRLWERQEIILTIDGGQTNTKVACELVKVRIPQRHITTITYVTNYPGIVDVITTNQGVHLHDAVLVGGRLRPKSGTFVGRYAEACLNALNVRPDIAFVATSTVGETGEFCCSDFEESRFKAMMLGQPDTTLRCITADSTKIMAKQSSGWAFASFDSIDVVLTDHQLPEAAQPFVEAARSHGVLVFNEPAPAKSA